MEIPSVNSHTHSSDDSRLSSNHAGPSDPSQVRDPQGRINAKMKIGAEICLTDRLQIASHLSVASVNIQVQLYAQIKLGESRAAVFMYESERKEELRQKLTKERCGPTGPQDSRDKDHVARQLAGFSRRN
jgi:hypothetical protein